MFSQETSSQDEDKFLQTLNNQLWDHMVSVQKTTILSHCHENLNFILILIFAPDLVEHTKIERALFLLTTVNCGKI
jgi:hypothetical protein